MSDLVTIEIEPGLLPRVTAEKGGVMETWTVGYEDLTSCFTKIPDPPMFFPPSDLLATNGKNAAVWWRPPGRSSVILAGAGDKLQQTLLVPLPGLVLFTTQNNGTSLYVTAVKGKERPKRNDPLFYAPFPNIDGKSGKVCYGGGIPYEFSLEDSASAWQGFFSSAFSSHTATGRSKKYDNDVRLMLIELHEYETVLYPENDLIQTGKTLEDWWSREE